MFYGGGETSSSADGESKREDRTMKSSSKPTSQKVARKEFLTDPAASTPRGISFLSGVEDDRMSDEKKQKRPRSNRLTKAVAARQGFGELVEISSPIRPVSDLILSKDAMDTLSGVANEFRRGDEVRRHGLKVRSKLLFCGPPGCGKQCAPRSWLLNCTCRWWLRDLTRSSRLIWARRPAICEKFSTLRKTSP